ncbi:hypothetical protein Y032_0317g2323 [Ancylostoma ceylanicum]|nr:hypothetical protein Y032_0317g2323 [Ancylostoma ceylanicum]
MSAERACTLQIVAGFFGFLNAFVAAMQNAEKSSHLELYINTHWITSIVFFAGLSRLLMIRSWIAEVLSVTLQLLCLCITVNALAADLWNLHVLSALNASATSYVITPTKVAYVKMYNGIDSLLSAVSFLLAAYIIFLHFNTAVNTCRQVVKVKFSPSSDID